MQRSIANRVLRRVRQRIIYGLRKRIFYPWIYRARWHAAVAGGRNEGSVVTHYLTAEPHPGAGIGHQMANWIAGYHFAQVFGCEFAHSPFPDQQWETLLNFGADSVLAEELSRRRISRVRLPLFNEDSTLENETIARIVNSYRDRPVLFVLEYDQFFRAQYPVAKSLAEKFARANPSVLERRLGGAPLRIAVHVRRGDVNEMSANPNIRMRWIDVGYFQKVLEQILTALDGASVRIELFSQGRSDDFVELEKIAPICFRTEDDPQTSFRDMVSADILITSKSSFSYKAALLSRGLRIVPANFWHGYPDDPLWIRADDRGNIRDDQIIHGVAALQSSASRQQ